MHLSISSMPFFRQFYCVFAETFIFYRVKRLFFNRLEIDRFRDFSTLLHSVFLEKSKHECIWRFPQQYGRYVIQNIFIWYSVGGQKRNKLENVKIILTFEIVFVITLFFDTNELSSRKFNGKTYLFQNVIRTLWLKK